MHETATTLRSPLSALFVLGIALTPSMVFAQTPPDGSPTARDPMASSTTTPPPVTPAPPPPPTAAAPVKVDSASTSIKFGFLAQPQYEALGSVNLDGMSHNLFLRRARILIGGSLFGMFDYFFDTDFANLMRGASPGMPGGTVKNVPGLNIQDVFLTYKPMADLIKVDVGYMLPPLSHNALQGAGTLFGWDYFAYTFQHSAGGLGGANVFGSGTGNPVGRDAGVQARGLLIDGHLEYRAGFYQGVRNGTSLTDVGGRNFFRFAARVQVNLFDAEPGFFYAGTYFGSKKILSLGLSTDLQDSYAYFAGDLFADLPLGPGVFTGQLNLAHWDGGTISGAGTLPKQTALSAEAGYTLTAVSVSPIVRFDQLWQDGAAVNQTRIAAGVAFWPYMHNSNLKLFYTRIIQEGAPHGANQINLQWQLYFF